MFNVRIHSVAAAGCACKYGRPVKALSLTLLLLAGCSYYHARSPGEKIRYEEKVGREFALEASTQLKLYDEPEVLDFVKRTGQLIAVHIPGSLATYKFFTVRDPTMNAFAVPGGYIYVFLGLLAQTKSLDELAGVLGHEIAHVEANHFIRSQKKMEIANVATLASMILAAFVGSGEQAAAVGTLAQAAQLTTALHYSREFEREADLMAIRYLRAAGFNTKGVVDLFETFYAKAKLNADDLPPYFYTHPLPAERINEVRTWIMVQRPTGRPPPPAVVKGFDLARVTAMLRLNQGHLAIEEQLKAIAQDPPDAHALFLLGYLYLKKGDLAPAQESLAQAYRSDPARPEYALYLGRAYFLAGKLEQAAETLQAAATLDPYDALAEVFQGDLLVHQHDEEGALAHYKKALSLNPESPFVHTALAMGYGRMGDTGTSYYHIGMANKHAGQYLKALHYFRKALKHLDPKGAVVEAVREEIKSMEG